MFCLNEREASELRQQIIKTLAIIESIRAAHDFEASSKYAKHY